MKPFRIGTAYVEWAHGPGAESGHGLAKRICDSPVKGGRHVIEDPLLVAEIADVADLYVGGRRGDNDLRAAGHRARAVKWLRERGLTVKSAFEAANRRD